MEQLTTRPHTTPLLERPLASRQTTGGSRRAWIHRNRGRQLSLEQVKPLVQGSEANIKSEVDPDAVGSVNKEKFRQVLGISQGHVDTLLKKVCARSGGTVDDMQFLRSFRGAPVARRACSIPGRFKCGGRNTSTSRPDMQRHLKDKVCARSGETADDVQFLRSLRGAPVARRACSIPGGFKCGGWNTSMSLSDIQRQLKDKIGGNLRALLRVFRSFDRGREGCIRQPEFRRVLDNYCIKLTDKEFQRLWNHYSPNDTSTISYELFLETLGFCVSHRFKIAPVCTGLEVPSRGRTPPVKIKQTKRRPATCEAASAPPNAKPQSLFHATMCVNSTPVWQALQASDTTQSGLVQQDVLRAILSSFIFPMNPQRFQRLTSCYGVKPVGPVRWKRFLSHFASPVKEGESATVHTDSFQFVKDEDSLDLQDLHPQLKEVSHQLVLKGASWITRADLQHFLERSAGTGPRLRCSHIAELLNALDPAHTGVIWLSSLERLNPKITSPSSCPSAAAPPPSPAHTTEPLDVPAETKDVEDLLLDKLCEQLGSALAALKLCDPQDCGYVTREEVKRALSCAGASISDAHLNRLCNMSGPGELVHYSGFLRSLGVPLNDVTISFSAPEKKPLAKKQRPHTCPASQPQPFGEKQPPSGLKGYANSFDILDIVFQRMKMRLEQRRVSLGDRVEAVIHRTDGMLSKADVQKLLEDSWVTLDKSSFNKFTEQLGFRDGRIESSMFLLKYEEATANKKPPASDGPDAKDNPQLLSAEQWMAAMRKRIKIIHGDNRTAFRIMDRRRKGVAVCRDFRELYNSLGLSCTEEEYRRLLDLIGLHSGGNLHYVDFVKLAETHGTQRTQRASVREQLHELLACDARSKWADMSKVLCQFDSHRRGWIHKKSLRELLFTYALPLRPDEFDELWSRYDPQGKGCVAVCDFLEKLGLPLNQAAAQQDADGKVLSAAASLEGIQQMLEERCEELKESLIHLDVRGDGTVTVEQLLSLLNSYGASIQKEPLVNHLHRMNLFTDGNYKRLAYLELLSAFGQKAEEDLDFPPSSPSAVHLLESLDNLSPPAALARMQTLVAASANNLYKAFSAFERKGTGMVKALDFRQVLNNFCGRLSDKQYRFLLTKLELDSKSCLINWRDFLDKFQSQNASVKEFERVWRQTPVNEQNEQQHREFLKRSGVVGRTPPAEGWGDASSLPSISPGPSETVSARKSDLQNKCTSRHPASVGRPGTGSLLGSAESRMRRAVRRCWREIQRNCTKTDHQREGHISATSFLEILRSLGIDVTPEQFERLVGTFGIVANGCVSYLDFLQHFLLKLDPSTTKRAFGRHQLPFPTTQASVLSRDGVEVMLRIHAAVRSSWSSLRRCFLTCDRSRTGFVSVQDFRKVLQRFSVNLSEEELFHLSSYFDASATGKICYNSFLWPFLH